MSISSRITAMEGHISNAYDGLEDLGVDLTNVDKNIDNIASKLEEVWQGYPKVSESDEIEATLNETKAGRMEIDLKGNTEQTQLTGKNLFDISKVLSNWNDTTNTGIKNNNDNTLTISAPNTSSSVLALSPNKLSDYCPELEVGDIVYLNAETTGTQKFIYLSASSTSWAFGTQKTITQNDLDSNVYWYSSGVSTQATISNIMIRNNGTTVDFEPYCGGIPSPNPSFPQQIYNVTGDVNVKIQNKNLFDKNTAKQNYILNANGEEVSSTGSFVSDYIFLKAGTNYYNNKRGYSNAGFFDLNKTFIERTTLSQNNVITVAKNCYVKVNGTLVNIDTYQLEENTSATSYVSHQEQNLPLTLGNIELNKIDTAQDYFYRSSGKWYLHKEIDKIIYNGSEDGWSTEVVREITNYKISISTAVGGDTRITCFSNYFTGVSGQRAYDGSGTNIIGIGASKTLRIRNTSFTTVQELKTWLSTHNLIVYYILATPTNTEVIDTTLINQLEAIYKAKSYDDQTNISQTNDELPFILDIEALKNN